MNGDATSSRDSLGSAFIYRVTPSFQIAISR